MFAARIVLSLALCLCLCQHYAAASSSTDELSTCEEQLSKYRRFLLQAILSFEDVCDAYNAHPVPLEGFLRAGGGGAHGEDAAALLRNYQPAAEQRSEIWAFFKLLMAQFNDLEFTNIIREGVIERCRIKSQLQRDEKRNSVVLGKKQRFHSWGGKRASLPGMEQHNDGAERAFLR